MEMDNANKYTWEDFENDCYYEQLIVFFNNLLTLHKGASCIIQV